MSLLAAAILAGGASTRMGRDKAELRLHGATLLERTVQAVQHAGLGALVVGRQAPAAWSDARTRFLPDAAPGAGPLPAIIQALRACPGEDLLVLACDLPGITPATIRCLADAWRSQSGHQGLVAVVDGEMQPLCAVYGETSRATLEAAWDAGMQSVRRVLTDEPGFLRLVVPEVVAQSLVDCDTPEDWRRLALPPEA